MKDFLIMTRTIKTAALLLVLLTATHSANAQSGATRPRRVNPAPAPTPAATRAVSDTGATTGTTTPRRTTTPARTAPAATQRAASAGTARAFELFQQKQFEAAVREAKLVTANDPANSEAWKIAGFAEMELKRYAEAAADLQRALELQRAAGEEDANTSDALATAYVRTEKFAEALPLLVAATTRAGAKPDALTYYYRGLAEYRTNRRAEAEVSFNAAVKADPKNSASLFYLGRMAFERKDDAAAIQFLNRATTADPRLAEGWTLLTYSYLRRADAAGGEGPKADADYLSAIRASESLVRLRPDEAATALHGQALIRAKQYARAATALERVAASPEVKGETLYLLGFAYTQAKNSPKAVAALERAAAKTPQDVNIYRILGYNFEVLKQYAKALAAYEKGLTFAPEDAELKQSAERIRPFAQ
ncbi:MAG TPA: tetratricopeptide repeat protein [Pyrinomonadaceae bacterium]|nr:tetratricopeptide repeat protein [Pyrinomonadaceae bacterium]